MKIAEEKKRENRITLGAAAHAINHPIRLAIIDLLRQNTDGLPVHEILEHFRKNAHYFKSHFKNSVEQPMISSHLKFLLDAGFVDKTPNGKERIYQLETGVVDHFDDLCSYWTGEFEKSTFKEPMTPLSIPSLSPSQTPFD